MKNAIKIILVTLVLSYSCFTHSQIIPVFPTTGNPQIPQVQHYGYSNAGSPVTNPKYQINDLERESQRQQNQDEQIKREFEQNEKQRKEILSQVESDINELSVVNYNLPSLSNQKGTKYYRDVYDKMLALNIENYSVKDLNFQIENAYFENKLDKAEFDKTIKQTGKFIIAKMKELNYDTNSNTAKNFMLFEFFSQTLQLKGFKEKHFPLKYDFEDNWGRKDWSKMFVTKLLRTGTGQCHSMPFLYLILAEEIGAKAYLSFSPNHSYIKFQDEKSKWYNLELTNGMFTVSSFILNNGFIRAEAMQNKIYMQNLSKQELLSQFYTDLALGYLHRFGYDDFVEKVANKALELYPKNINANMVKANYNTVRFKYVMKQLGINPEKKQELQQIKNYPQAIVLLNETNGQYQKIDDLGFQLMPAEAYEKWLGSLKEAKNKQENETFKKQFKGLVIKKTKG
ncbi:hypothetical protein [Flavobacterium aestivum]|uniref:hypothetical protein n=1 Tax=Flavobacterium aestivum TaxID=3003257 RepID=UPI002482FC4C|nr:hypothetical protein [Flavobacterium aestivum]